MKKTRLQAHRGVSTEAPENTVAAFKMSVEQGYDIIELDTKYTKDGKCVVLHDPTLNRTCRLPGGKSIQDELKISDITLEEALSFDAGIAMDSRFAGEKIPTFVDMLDFFKNNSISCKIDNVWESFTAEQKTDFIELVKASGAEKKMGFSCQNLENLKRVVKELPGCEIHWDGALDEEILHEVKRIAAKHRLTIWIRYDNKTTSWSKYPFATPELCDKIRQFGKVGIWILSEAEELRKAVTDFKADAIETTGSIKPWML